MPMTITPSKTPKGKPYLRMMSSGDVSAADGEGLTKTIAPGSPLANMAILGMVADGARFSPDGRHAFTRSGAMDEGQAPVAVVVNSAPLRVMLTFVIRISGAATRFFNSETDALAWLDEKLEGA